MNTIHNVDLNSEPKDIKYAYKLLFSITEINNKEIFIILRHHSLMK